MNEILVIIDGHVQEFKSMIFVKDSPYLWASIDSTSRISFIKNQITKTTTESGRILKINFADNMSTLYFQLAFLIVMSLLFFYLGRKIRNIPFNKQNRE